MNKITNKKGFNLIEIIISMAILMIIFSFVFYFVSSINFKKNNKNEKPYILQGYNYSNKYCYLEDNQINNLSIIQNIYVGEYVSSSTPITSLHIFNTNKLIITTNSASTTEPDIYLFDLDITDNQININLIKSLNIGPGINDSLLHDNYLYALNTSVNSHIQTFKINPGDSGIYSLTMISELKIDELSASYSMPKKIYLYDKKLIIGSEKNNSGGELIVFNLDQNNIPQDRFKSIEINGQVNDIFENQGYLYIANASDIELFVYNKDSGLVYSYDAPLSLGNGRAVYYLNPYIYLGRTVSSFELFYLKVSDNLLSLVNKYKTYGSIDFIQSLGKYILIISNDENNELKFYSQDLKLIKNINLPTRVNSYTCLKNSFLFAYIINNQSQILWLK